MAKKNITNAMRILTLKKIAFETLEYEADSERLADNTFGMSIAELTGIEPERSFKTLVGRGDKTGIIVFCVPVNHELSLKKAARETGNKRVELVLVKELQALTGYIRGGVSPIGMKKAYMTVIHKSVEAFQKIAVSGGACGITLLLETEDLLRITGAKTADIAE